MTSNKFWLYEWIDSYDIHTIGQAEKLIKQVGPRRDLQARATEVPYTTESIPRSDSPTIIAGCAIDLSGHLDCFAWECMKKQVDNLFSHVLHYFDRIVVVGPGAHEYSTSWSEENEQRVIKRLSNYIRLLLYIRKIGAEDLFLFRQKPPPCQIHLRQHLKEVGFERSLIHADTVTEQLARAAEISIRVHEDHFHYTFNHSEFEHTVWGVVDSNEAGDKSKHALDRAVAKSVFGRYLAELTSDIRTAKRLKSPLGSTVKFHGQLLKSFQVRPQDTDVAFKLDLPVLRGIEPATLVRIRQDEKQSFERFRQSIRIAIKERLNTREDDTETIAREIRTDLVSPALNDIEKRLSAARNTLAKKAGLSITIGSLATICGLLTTNPLFTSAGVAAAVGGTLNAGYKAIEDEESIRLSDMYFLWQAKRHKKEQS